MVGGFVISGILLTLIGLILLLLTLVIILLSGIGRTAALVGVAAIGLYALTIALNF